ncbi:hypothetical protein GXP67_35020 [Rhodocytophaga rosea]|uniref:HAMP domain-containing histidine kinase n=1 Tax=Rhodocytophaga rosea TaxID=2704465 RepID=A0A6C0GTL4_9BACT|nr:hypothetical protein [Rhodocytophaga rosea]QHT71505.1 hypothetical protein GXP67_35020 [Rhodocytophaga rosea]
MDHYTLSKTDLQRLYKDIYSKADKIIEPILGAMFLFGLLIAFFYDTWLIAIGIGSLNMLAYVITKKMLPESNLYQYILSVISAIFAAQYIYQMHGMAEMHFWVFISSTLLIIYQNWRLQLPLILMVYLHHGLFAYLQYSGYSEVYFTQLAYMDLTAFLFHALLATGVCGISAIWGYTTSKRTLQDALNIKTLSALQEELRQNACKMDELNTHLIQVNEEVHLKNERLHASEEELRQINENLNALVAHRTQALLKQNQKLLQHAYINAHKVRAPLARILGLVHLFDYETEWKENEKILIDHLNLSARELDKILKEVSLNLEMAEFKE